MKRQLSLVLALVMILGSFSAVFAAEATVAETAAEFLAKEGVLSGYAGSGDLGLEDNLLRQDTLVLVARLLGEFDEAKAHEGEVTYEDVKDPTYVPLAAWAKENDTFVGHSDSNFGFGENLTAQEYAKVLLVALDYTVGPNGDKDVSWKDALTKAKDLGILADVKVENATEITRGEMAVMTYNALGTNLKGSKETLADKLGIKMPVAGELTAKVEDTTNLKEVVLQLSNAKLADEDKLENANNYKVVGYDVEKVEVIGNDVVILLGEGALGEDALLKDRDYKLRVRSIEKAINGEYSFKAKDNAIPSVEEVKVLGEYGIKLRTSEPINILENVRGRSFVVDGKNIAMDVEVYGRDVVLTPYYNDSFSKDAKTLSISGLADFAGFKSATEKFDIEIEKDEVEPKVVDVILRSNRTVDVVFDKDVYVETVKAYEDKNNLGNISYQSGRHNVYAEDVEISKDNILLGAEKIDTNKVRYRFKNDFLRTRTDFTIVDVANHSKVKMEKTTQIARVILDDVEPEIFKRELLSKKVDNGTAKSRLFFDKEVQGVFVKDSDNNEFVVGNHFTLYDREVNGRNLSVNGKVVKAYYATIDGQLRRDVIDVELEGLTEWDKFNEHDYVLQIENFVDFASRTNRMFRDYHEFKFERTEKFAVENVIVEEYRNETRINIRFTKSVDRLTAEDATNYIFTNNEGSRKDVKDLKGTIVTERNGYEVTLILPDFKVEKYDYFRILDTLKDKNDNRLDSVHTRYFRFSNEELKDVQEKVEAIVEAEYTPESFKAYEKALAAAQKLSAKTQEEVAAKVKALNEALALLVKDDTVVDVDTKALDAALVEAAALEAADYTEESFAAFEAALAEAKELPITTQEEVDAKLAAVKAAVALLEKDDTVVEELKWEVTPSVLFSKLEGKINIPAELKDKVVVKYNETEIDLNEDGSFEVYGVTAFSVKITVEVDGVEDTTLGMLLPNF